MGASSAIACAIAGKTVTQAGLFGSGELVTLAITRDSGTFSGAGWVLEVSAGETLLGSTASTNSTALTVSGVSLVGVIDLDTVNVAAHFGSHHARWLPVRVTVYDVTNKELAASDSVVMVDNGYSG